MENRIHTVTTHILPVTTHICPTIVTLPVTTVAPHDGTGIRIRQAERADLLAICRIERSSFEQPWSFEIFEQFLSTPGFLVADDGHVLGYIVADTTTTPGGRVGHIKDIAVHESHRGRGIGSTLLTRGLALLDGTVRSVKLEVRESNEVARSLYETHGFRFAKRIPGYYGDGEDALVLIRQL